MPRGKKKELNQELNQAISQLEASETLLKKALPDAVEVLNVSALKPCVGTEDSAGKYLKALGALCKEFNFTSAEFVRQFRSFRLYRGLAHVDWISLDELNVKYMLGLPPAKGASRNYQKPVKRQYR